MPPGQKPAPASRRGAAVPKMTGDLLGVVILAIGVGAFIGMAYLGYARFFKPPSYNPPREQAETALAGQQQETVSAAEDCPTCGHDQREEQLPLPSERNLKIPSERDLEGSWQVDFGYAKAFFQISKGAFQVIYATGGTRYYSRGTYVYDLKEGILTLTPNSELGAPETTPGVIYNVLTQREFAVQVAQDKKSDDLFWTGGKEAKGPMHPLFLYTQTGDRAIRWSRPAS